jgi:hypothetical protein
VKFIGVLDRADGSRLAMFSDCSAGRHQSTAREGGTVDGRYRLVKIGRESVIIEHLDGRGRTTLAGCDEAQAGVGVRAGSSDRVRMRGGAGVSPG